MKQLVQNLRTGRLALKDVPYPLCKHGGVVVKSENSLISIGTEKSIVELAKKNLLGKAKARPDLFRRAVEKARKEGFLKVFKEAMNRLDEPFPLGYSASGVVVETGNGLENFDIGDRVAISGSGYASHSEYNFVPENLCAPIPKKTNGDYLDFEEAAFCMVGAIAMHSVNEVGARTGDTIAVIGLGLIGLLTVQILKAKGCEPIGIDIDDDKVNIAKRLGCEHWINTDRCNGEDWVMSLTG
jgi:threonine dehydrogenase-like Zn-dependent dehydrogenase